MAPTLIDHRFTPLIAARPGVVILFGIRRVRPHLLRIVDRNDSFGKIFFFHPASIISYKRRHSGAMTRNLEDKVSSSPAPLEGIPLPRQ